VGAVLRVIWAIGAEPPVELRDPTLYLVLSDNVASGHGYSYGPGPDQGTTAYYPPGYPLALGAAIWAARALVPGTVSAFDVAIWGNVVLSIATIALVFVLGRRLVGNRVGLAAAAIWALWPNLIFHSGIVLTETLFLFLLVLLLICVLGDREAARAPGAARLASAGVLLGLLLLVRPVSLVLAPAFLVLWWGPAVRTVLWRLAVTGLACLAVLVPWSVRSSLAMDAPVALSLNLGDNLCLGHNPGATGAFGDLGAHCYTASDLRRPESETRRQSENIDRAVTYIREHPGETLRRTPSKLRYTLEGDADGLDVAEDWGTRPIMSSPTRDALDLAADGFYYLVAAAAVVGGVIWLRRPDLSRRGLFLVVAGLAQLVSPMATFGDPRFKMPIYPTLAVCAAVAVAALWDRVTERPRPAHEAADAGEEVPTPVGAGAGAGSPA
jgi:Dolichyl-phosphate-mannose-protein mannosyltransferase